MWYRMRFDISNRLMDHDCDGWTDGQTDRQTDRQTELPIAIARSNDAR